MTKLYFLLLERGMSQRDLQRAIQDKFGVYIGDDRISKIVNGKITNITINTAKQLAQTLEVGLDEIID